MAAGVRASQRRPELFGPNGKRIVEGAWIQHRGSLMATARYLNVTLGELQHLLKLHHVGPSAPGGAGPVRLP
jgi:hypothetical protein